MKAKPVPKPFRSLRKKATPPPGDVTVGDYEVAWADKGTAWAGKHGVAASSLTGWNSKRLGAKALNRGVAVSGKRSSAEVANYGVARVGDGGTAMAGSWGIASCHKDGYVIAANYGVAICNEGGQAMSAESGVIVLGYKDPVLKRTVLKVGRLEPDGKLKPRTWYRLNKAGAFEEAPPPPKQCDEGSSC